MGKGKGERRGKEKGKVGWEKGKRREIERETRGKGNEGRENEKDFI